MKKLPLFILLAIILGVICGFLLPPLSAVHLVGQLFLRLLKMIIIPLIATSLVSGVLSMKEIRAFGRMGGLTLLYYLGTSGLAIVTGLAAVNIIRPGIGTSLTLGSVQTPAIHSVTLEEILLHLVPDNLFSAMVAGEILPIIFFSLLLGAVLIALPRDSVKNLANLFEEGFTVMMKMTTWILYTAPIGIWALVTDLFSRTGLDAVKPLAWYFVTVLLALAIHFTLTLPLILKFVARRNPLNYFKALFPALATAFSTASSSATLPLTMECVEKGAGIDNRIASFVLPLGATINMDGTALYEAVAAIFIAQVYGIGLTLPQQAMIFVTALLASIGAAGIPMAGLVMMAVVLRSVGLPLEGVGLIIGVDRFLDMLRTATNVWSDSVGCSVVKRLGSDLDP